MIKSGNKNIELLAPAGNLHKMKTAIAFGADAVYLGVPDYSLRVRINDFNLAGMAEAVDYCRQAGVKVYVTLNIFAHNRHLEGLPLYVKELRRLNVDALIASDPGVIRVIRENWPDVPIHLSTQANCTNWRCAKFWYEQGVERVILGREVALNDIREIKKLVPKLELEYFVHGAMCMAYSGRCFLSKLMSGRSGNLGDCVQPCRWEYNESGISPKGHEEVLEIVEEEHGSYILNSQDLCLLPYIRPLAEAGVASFKIEGRAKSAYYQAVVTGIYREALDLLVHDKLDSLKLDELYKELESKLVHRGYTTGFLLGDKAEQNTEVSHYKCAWEFCGQVVRSEKSEVRSEKKVNIVQVHNSIKTGDEVEVVMPYYAVDRIRIDKLYNIEGEEIAEAHGGQGMEVLVEGESEWPRYSVLRRRIG